MAHAANKNPTNNQTQQQTITTQANSASFCGIILLINLNLGPGRAPQCVRRGPSIILYIAANVLATGSCKFESLCCVTGVCAFEKRSVFLRL